MQILLISDECSIHPLYQEELEEEGHHVYQAFSGDVGISLFQAIEFDIILIVSLRRKEGMHDVNVKSVIDAVKSKNDSIPICVVETISGYLHDEAEKADAILVASSDLTELTDTLKKLSTVYTTDDRFSMTARVHNENPLIEVNGRNIFYSEYIDDMDAFMRRTELLDCSIDINLMACRLLNMIRECLTTDIEDVLQVVGQEAQLLLDMSGCAMINTTPPLYRPDNRHAIKNICQSAACSIIWYVKSSPKDRKSDRFKYDLNELERINSW